MFIISLFIKMSEIPVGLYITLVEQQQKCLLLTTTFQIFLYVRTTSIYFSKDVQTEQEAALNHSMHA